MTDIDNDAGLAVYNERLIALSARAGLPRVIDSPDIAAKAVSPICGSEVSVALQIKDNKISAFGYEVEACALTKTVVAVMQTAIIGKTRDDVRRAGAAMENMLSGSAFEFDDGWQDLDILQPVKDYKARHNSILLPFEAVEKAFKAQDKGL